MAVTLISASATVVNGDSRVYSLTLIAGPTVDATLSLKDGPSGNERGYLAAKAGDTRVLEFHQSNQLHKSLLHCAITGTGAKALLQYDPA